MAPKKATQAAKRKAVGEDEIGPIKITLPSLNILYDSISNKHLKMESECRELFRRLLNLGSGLNLRQAIVHYPPLPSLAEILDGVLMARGGQSGCEDKSDKADTDAIAEEETPTD